ncbi:hypothetical protein WMY93_033937 [Mugilogobius chulae]|uniref:WD repeat domain phosphoinositide-interacting protein 4 n=1 Tax=Mugilogobius chulae TaxID=88201 RepID=A0AAW0MJF6_9GOBI
MATSFRNKLFYLYHMMEGKVTPVPSVRGLTEARVKQFSVCPVGDAVCCGDQRLPAPAAAQDERGGPESEVGRRRERCVFLLRRKQSLLQLRRGRGLRVDLRSSRCLSRFTDDGCVKSTSMAASPNGRLLACGSQSGVVNIYSQDSCFSSSRPKPLKSVMNLVTPVTSLKFNSSSELLLLGSRTDDDAVKMLHVPSLSVFSNFPVSKRKLCHKVQDVDFSPNSGFFCLVNNRGRAPLYRSDTPTDTPRLQLRHAHRHAPFTGQTRPLLQAPALQRLLKPRTTRPGPGPPEPDLDQILLNQTWARPGPGPDPPEQDLNQT